MTYPPQQPGPGQFNQPNQQQPYQGSYQGLGSYSGGQGGPGNGKNTGKIVAIVLIAVLVLGGGGVATYFLTKGGDDPKNDASTEQTNRDDSKDTGSDDPSDDASSDRDPDEGGGDSDASNSPDDVRDDYMAAYENKDFADVVDSACKAYKTKFGTDTSELESKLADYDISASPDGEVEVDDQHPDSATAKIDLTLTGGGQTQEPKILIKIVQESGEWRFCGEGSA